MPPEIRNINPNIMIIKNMLHPLDILRDRIIYSMNKIVNLLGEGFLSWRRVARGGAAPSQHFPPSQTQSKSIVKIYRFERGD